MVELEFSSAIGRADDADQPPATGASDAQFLNPAGIPTYGIDGSFYDPDGGYAHGLNERIRVQSVYEGRTFLYRLIKIYADLMRERGDRALMRERGDGCSTTA